MERSKQIFIVEDNELYSLMLDYMISNNSRYRFVRFSSGEECLENLYLSPDIVILDYELPGIDGYDTLQQIKQRDPNIRVLILTRLMDNELEAELRSAGADDYILKQDGADELVLSRIRLFMEERHDGRRNFNLNAKRLFEGFWGG